MLAEGPKGGPKGQKETQRAKRRPKGPQTKLLVVYKVFFCFACCVCLCIVNFCFIPLKTRLLDSIVHAPCGDGHHRLGLCLCHRCHRALLLLLSGKRAFCLLEETNEHLCSWEPRTRLDRRTRVRWTGRTRRTNRLQNFSFSVFSPIWPLSLSLHITLVILKEEEKFPDNSFLMANKSWTKQC